MIRAVTTALFLTLTATASAQQTPAAPLAPALRSDVLATSEIVRIGDLVDNAGAAASIPVFRAPDL